MNNTVTYICPICGSVVKAGDTFCLGCGTPLQPIPPQQSQNSPSNAHSAHNAIQSEQVSPTTKSQKQTTSMSAIPPPIIVILLIIFISIPIALYSVLSFNNTVESEIVAEEDRKFKEYLAGCEEEMMNAEVETIVLEEPVVQDKLPNISVYLREEQSSYVKEKKNHLLVYFPYVYALNEERGPQIIVKNEGLLEYKDLTLQNVTLVYDSYTMNISVKHHEGETVDFAYMYTEQDIAQISRCKDIKAGAYTFNTFYHEPTEYNPIRKYTLVTETVEDQFIVIEVAKPSNEGTLSFREAIENIAWISEAEGD